MFPRKPVAGFYESHDSFIGHGIIQHDGNPQFVVHVIGRIDAGNLVEAVRLFRPDFYIEDINLFGIVVFVENRACYAHNQGEPFSIKGMAERPIGRIPFRTAPRKIRPDLELIQDVLDKAVCLRGSEQDIVAAEGGDVFEQGGIGRPDSMDVRTVGGFLTELVVVVLGHLVPDAAGQCSVCVDGKDRAKGPVQKGLFQGIAILRFAKSIREHLTFYPSFSGKDGFFDGVHDNKHLLVS